MKTKNIKKLLPILLIVLCLGVIPKIVAGGPPRVVYYYGTTVALGIPLECLVELKINGITAAATLTDEDGNWLIGYFRPENPTILVTSQGYADYLSEYLSESGEDLGWIHMVV